MTVIIGGSEGRALPAGEAKCGWALGQQLFNEHAYFFSTKGDAYDDVGITTAFPGRRPVF